MKKNCTPNDKTKVGEFGFAPPQAESRSGQSDPLGSVHYPPSSAARSGGASSAHA
jgi:hypothetical protein